jgi:23S rRNA (uracil1939-C5)-methyltransferase
MAQSTVRVRTTAMSTDGRAVGRLDSGKVVFVDGALPDEEVEVVIESAKSSFASARLSRVVVSSVDRRVPPCPRLGEGCGGCQWQHASAGAQLRYDSILISESLRRIGRIADPPVLEPVELAPWRGRTTIRVGVHDGRAALRRGASHDLVPIEGCLIAHPLLLPYLSGRRYPGARALTLRCGARTGEVLIDATPAGRVELPDEVATDHFHEIAAGRRWRISARSFFQSRPDGADALAGAVAAAAGAGGGRRAVDLYAGVGLFAGVLAGAGWSVVAVEGSHRSVADARVNLADLDVRVVEGDVNAWRADEAADLVVADPSRAGLGRDGAATAVAVRAPRVILISCDAASLGRDAALLIDHGYRLVSVTPIHMFPQSRHIEAVSLFETGRR